MIDAYTKLLEKAAESENDEVAKAAVGKLVEHLRTAGRLKVLPSIASELRKVQARRKALMPYVEVAHQKDAAQALKEAASEGIKASKAHVNHSLISGFRARGGGKLVDRTGKRALIDIYRNVTR
jgi:F0F1-type ATP synthase delta subunit